MKKDVTGPDDDEQYGHGGVEVPIDDIDDVPGALGDPGDDSA